MTSIYTIIIALTFILLERYYYLRKKNEIGYRYYNFISNVSIGICERLIYLFMLPLFYGIFNYIYIHYHLFAIPDKWYYWIVLLLFTDFVWYCYHWLGHRINILWAAHIVHHQSEDYNLTVAARVTIFQAYIRTLFWCVLPLIGFNVDMVMGILIFHGAYSFFTHTQLGKNLHFLEYVFITPSLHGIHHASNAKYLDKNFGDVFVFWDKLFGTFQKEEEKPVYGLTQPFESHSFLWQHFHYYIELFYLAKTKTGGWNKINVFFVSPEYMDSSIRPKLEKKWLKTEKRQLAAPLKSYLNFQLSLCLLLLAITTYLFNNTSWLIQAEVFVFIILTLINVGAIIEQKKYIFYLELIRLWQAFLFVALVTDTLLVILVFSIVIQLLLYFLPIKLWYYKMLYKQVI